MTIESPHKIAVIDIGSNSVRLVIYEISGKAFTLIYNEKVLAGLGRDLHITGKLHPLGRRLAFDALKRFKILLGAQFGVTAKYGEILIAATAALRDAEDAEDFIVDVSREIGFDIRPLTGSQEAYMSAMGVIAGDSRVQGVVADLGGASLELVDIQASKPSGGISHPLGPFSLFKDVFDPKILRTKIMACLEDAPSHTAGQNLYLIGGAWRNLALIQQKRSGYPLRIAHNYELNFETAKELSQWAYSQGGIAEINNWRGLSERRAETLPYAGLLLEILLKIIKPCSVIIAPGGLREGIIYDALSKLDVPELNQASPLFSGCMALAKGREHNEYLGGPLFECLSGLDGTLPSSFAPKNERRLRRAACLLSSIGKGLHPGHKARMAFRTILYAPLPDLDHSERAYLALMVYASYTSKPTTPNDEAIDYLLSEDAVISARIYGQAMRLGLDVSGRSHIILSQLSLSVKDETLRIYPEIQAKDLRTQRSHARLEKLADQLGLKSQGYTEAN
ncbi:MAG: Ppx/GppA family phosphatase [Robiginitomaculum sp.]|nr:Ppx/GppA family phosphatase [Robiginitomaculum sp.]